MKPSHRAIFVAMVTFGLIPITDARAVVYELGADWSSVANPNGVWSFNQGAAPLPFLQTNWAGTGGDGWTTSVAGVSPPAWVFAAAAFANASVGDVYVHSTNFDGPLARATWTSPDSGVIDISGQAWDVQHAAGRDDEWTLYLNATLLAHRDNIVGVVKDTANAAFANNLLLGQSLMNLAVNPGDVVTFEVRQTQNSFGHFTGVDVSIRFVPEPSGVEFAGVGMLTLWVGWRATRSGKQASRTT